MGKGDQTPRERKKESQNKKNNTNIYSTKHIRIILEKKELNEKKKLIK
tara:strand:- start:99 stop:242 length:144 start_codon:yes stop_codon:yes gene_type:complete